MLKVEQRVQILDAGLNDREPVVREECYKLLQNWLQYCKFDPIKLLSYLNVEIYEKVASEAIEAILFSRNIDQKPHHAIIDKIEDIIAKQLDEPLSNELCLFWRVFIEEQINEAIDRNATDEPCVQNFTNLEITQFCILIKAMTELEATDFSILQLLKLAQALDLSDEAGRRMLSLLLSDLIISPETSSEMLVKTLDLLRLVHPNDSEFIETVMDNIQTILVPLDQFRSDDKIRVLEEHLETLHDDLTLMAKQHNKETNKEKRRIYKEKIEEIRAQAAPLEEQLDIYDSLQQYVLYRTLDTLCLLFSRCPSVSKIFLQNVNKKKIF